MAILIHADRQTRLHPQILAFFESIQFICDTKEGLAFLVSSKKKHIPSGTDSVVDLFTTKSLIPHEDIGISFQLKPAIGDVFDLIRQNYNTQNNLIKPYHLIKQCKIVEKSLNGYCRVHTQEICL